MKLDHLDQDFVASVAELADHRKALAAANRDLRERELQARELRARCEEELRQGGEGRVALGKTDAEKQAKLHPDYLAFERETSRLEYERDVELANAEALSLELRATIAQDGVLN